MRAISGDSMSSSEARAAIRASHEALRGVALRTMTMAGDASATDDSLRLQGRTLCAAVEDHLDFEESLMAVALADVLGLEGVLLVQLEADHQRQRANAASTLAALAPDELARGRLIATVRALAESVLLDLSREERTFMRADVDELTNDSPGG
jgi:hypothetical protein